MAGLNLEYKLCLNNSIVPLSSRQEDLVDDEGLLGGDQSSVLFKFLPLHSNANMTWALKTLQKPCSEWKKQHKVLPILNEIRSALEGLKKKVGGVRQRKMPRCVVPLQIRGQTILVQHHVVQLHLAFRPGDELQILPWFLQELSKDFETLQNDEEHPEENQEEEEQNPKEDQEDSSRTWHQIKEAKIIEECLQVIKGYETVQHANWCPSRMSFKVTLVSKQTRFSWVPGLRKRRRAAGAHDEEDSATLQALQQQFDNVIQEVLMFLSEPAASSASAMPLEDM